MVLFEVFLLSLKTTDNIFSYKCHKLLKTLISSFDSFYKLFWTILTNVFDSSPYIYRQFSVILRTVWTVVFLHSFGKHFRQLLLIATLFFFSFSFFGSGFFSWHYSFRFQAVLNFLKNVSFSENSTYVLNGWSLTKMLEALKTLANIQDRKKI